MIPTTEVIRERRSQVRRWVYWHPVLVLVVLMVGGLFRRDAPTGSAENPILFALALTVLPSLIAAVVDAYRYPSMQSTTRSDESYGTPRPPDVPVRRSRKASVAVAVMSWALVDSFISLALPAALLLVDRDWALLAMFTAFAGLLVAFAGLVLVFAVVMCWLAATALWSYWQAARGFAAADRDPELPMTAATPKSGTRNDPWFHLGLALLLTGLIIFAVIVFAFPGLNEGFFYTSPQGRGLGTLLRVVVWSFIGGGPSGWLWVARSATAFIACGGAVLIRSAFIGRRTLRRKAASRA